MSTSSYEVEPHRLVVHGIIHEIEFRAYDGVGPWPQVLELDDGQGVAVALVHREDAEMIVRYLSELLNGRRS